MNTRIASLDVFRGFVMLLMIIVNSQSSSSYSLIQHADWNGFTVADFVFPGFLFIVGISCVLSLNRHLNEETRNQVYLSIIKRSTLLFLLGIILNIFPWKTDFLHLRIYGVLQRIALCYFVCTFIVLHTAIRTQLLLLTAILAGYWFLMTQVAVPSFGINQLTPEGSWVAYIDQLLFSSQSLFEKTYDPEGLLSTLPAIATTLFGVLIGHLLVSRKMMQEKKLIVMISIGIGSLIVGGLWSCYFPINKNLWTSSYVLWSGGLSLLLFSLCFYLVDRRGYTQWAFALKVLGMNALFIFIVHVLLLKIQFFIKLTDREGVTGNLQNYIINHLFMPFFSPPNAWLCYSLFFLLVNFLIALFLYHRKIFIRL